MQLETYLTGTDFKVALALDESQTLVPDLSAAVTSWRWEPATPAEVDADLSLDESTEDEDDDDEDAEFPGTEEEAEEDSPSVLVGTLTLRHLVNKAAINDLRQVGEASYIAAEILFCQRGEVIGSHQFYGIVDYEQPALCGMRGDTEELNCVLRLRIYRANFWVPAG